MRKAFIVLMALAALLSACGGNGEGGREARTRLGRPRQRGRPNGPGATAPTGPPEDCVDLTGEGPGFKIVMRDLRLHPDCFIASATQGIKVVNKDAALHSFTLVDTPIDVDIEGNETFNGQPIAEVLEPGTYTLLCRYHPPMLGDVYVIE